MIFDYIKNIKGNDSRRYSAMARVRDAYNRKESLRLSASQDAFPLLKYFMLPFAFVAFNFFLIIYFLYLLCFAIILKKRHDIRTVLSDDVICKLHDYWNDFPLISTMKMVEATLFVTEEFDSLVMEVGVHSGYHSFAINSGRKIDVGLEYLPDFAVSLSKKDKEGVFNNFISSDACDLPFLDSNFKTIYSIHSLDDMESDVQLAINVPLSKKDKGGAVWVAAHRVKL